MEHARVLMNGSFWAHHIRRVFIPALRALAATLPERLLPAFERIEEEAEGYAERRFAELGRAPGDGSEDPGACAEQANDDGICHYLTLCGVRQGMINLHAMSLFHLVEQMLCMIYRQEQDLWPSPSGPHPKADFTHVVGRMQACGIAVHGFSTWRTMDELRLVANVTKHAEGNSAVGLRTLNPDLFVPPSAQGKDEHPYPWDVTAPLLGDGLYVTPEQFGLYRDAAIRFLEELAAALDGR